VHQLAVRKSVQARAGADALDPEPPELPLLIAAIAVSEAIGAICGLLRGLKQFRFCKKKSFGALQVFLAARAPLCTAFHSSHFIFSCEESTRRTEFSAQRRLHGVLGMQPEIYGLRIAPDHARKFPRGPKRPAGRPVVAGCALPGAAKNLF
jgi:hypothetical protein